MKKILTFIISLLIIVGLYVSLNGIYVAKSNRIDKYKVEINKNEQSQNKIIKDLVESFGKKLQYVPLLAPKDILIKSMKENYGNYVTEALIEKWINDPLNAPGRLTSSPWPDRIEIRSINKIDECTYEVNGEIIEITSVEKETGEIAAKRAITLKVKKINNCWLIDDVVLGEYAIIK
ncbi:hypothetical protein ABG79_00940 [Caloramator mitchellensis]|uniref:DUF4829 domain-containing protein n=1 Tax=Caloramator mitchellensis TaxID=908809 RepID=A0A0R3JU90_CALMK|nr:hypothetical protein [Caloramator mitchellensis]KRQ87142.1 hypothetical protein ABG79_00940 [Caloramator mitchellensis]